MKAVIYTRVSTEDQDYKRQIAELQQYAKRNNIDVIEVLSEKESGFKTERTEFDKLKSYTKQDIDLILIWELSRLSRRSIHLQQTIQDFTDKGICVFALKDNIQTLNADGSINNNSQLIISMFATMVEQEVKTLKQRTLSSKQNKIRNEGKSYTYKAPLGYNYRS